MPSMRWLAEHVEVIWIREDERKCATCVHFYPHYVKDELGRFTPISVGHCTYPRTKIKRAEGECKNYKMKGEQL